MQKALGITDTLAGDTFTSGIPQAKLQILVFGLVTAHQLNVTPVFTSEKNRGNSNGCRNMLELEFHTHYFFHQVWLNSASNLTQCWLKQSSKTLNHLTWSNLCHVFPSYPCWMGKLDLNLLQNRVYVKKTLILSPTHPPAVDVGQCLQACSLWWALLISTPLWCLGSRLEQTTGGQQLEWVALFFKCNSKQI